MFKKGLGSGKFAGKTGSSMAQYSPVSPWDGRKYGSGRAGEEGYDTTIEFDVYEIYNYFGVSVSVGGPLVVHTPIPDNFIQRFSNYLPVFNSRHEPIMQDSRAKH